MDGFTDMALKLVENLLLVFSLIKETLAYAVDDETNQIIELLWKGLIGSSSWMGFAAYSLYGIGMDYGFEMDVCEGFGYLYYVIDGMNYIVAFANPEGGDVEGAANDALEALGLGTLDDLGLGGILPSGDGEEVAEEGEEVAEDAEAEAEDVAEEEPEAAEEEVTE